MGRYRTPGGKVVIVGQYAFHYSADEEQYEIAEAVSRIFPKAKNIMFCGDIRSGILTIHFSGSKFPYAHRKKISTLSESICEIVGHRLTEKRGCPTEVRVGTWVSDCNGEGHPYISIDWAEERGDKDIDDYTSHFTFWDD